jgi:type IV secretory pathway TrbD component
MPRPLLESDAFGPGIAYRLRATRQAEQQPCPISVAACGSSAGMTIPSSMRISKGDAQLLVPLGVVMAVVYRAQPSGTWVAAQFGAAVSLVCFYLLTLATHRWVARRRARLHRGYRGHPRR